MARGILTDPKQHTGSLLLNASWQYRREKVGTVADFIFLSSKIIVDGDCSHEIKRHFLLWKESFDKDPDAGKDWRQEEKGTTEDQMVGCHHQLDGHEYEQAPGAGDGQGSLAWCSPWHHKDSDTTEQLKWTELRQCNNKLSHHFANKSPSSQSYGFSSSHVWIWELDHKEDRTPKNWCFQIVMQKTSDSPLNSKEIKPVPKGNQTWIFIRRTDAEAEAIVLWSPREKSQLIGKDHGAWERVRTGGERGDRGWDGWMASPIQFIWAWANSGRLWKIGKLGMMQSMGLHDLTAEQQQWQIFN